MVDWHLSLPASGCQRHPELPDPSWSTDTEEKVKRELAPDNEAALATTRVCRRLRSATDSEGERVVLDSRDNNIVNVIINDMDY